MTRIHVGTDISLMQQCGQRELPQVFYQLFYRRGQYSSQCDVSPFCSWHREVVETMNVTRQQRQRLW